MIFINKSLASCFCLLACINIACQNLNAVLYCVAITDLVWSHSDGTAKKRYLASSCLISKSDTNCFNHCLFVVFFIFNFSFCITSQILCIHVGFWISSLLSFSYICRRLNKIAKCAICTVCLGNWKKIDRHKRRFSIRQILAKSKKEKHIFST